MASSPDKSSKDDDEDRDDDTSEPAEDGPATAEGAPAAKAGKSSAEADDEEEDDDDDEAGDDEPPPPPPPSKKRAAAKAQPAAKGDKGDKTKRPASKKAAATAGAPEKAAPQPAPAQPVQGTLGKSLLLFVIVVGGLALGFAVLGREEGGGAAPVPKWKTGQIVDVELTLVPSDNKDLSCASATELEGRHCQYEERGKPWSKGGQTDDAHTLKPYTTTDRMQFLAAGVWDQPALKGAKLPNTRFSLKCKYKVDGKIPKPFVRWNSDGQWFERNDDWFAGAVSDCAIVP